MTILTDHEIYYLTTVLRRLEEFKKCLPEELGLTLGTEALNDEIDWLNSFLAEQPITQLRTTIAKLSSSLDELTSEYTILQNDYQQARAGIDSLKHLQKYEGHQKAESDKLGHEVEVHLLHAEIDRLRAELDKANAAKA